MTTDRICFPPFLLDAGNERLWRGEEAIALRPKAFGVLRYLAERPGRLATKEELLDAIWPEINVSDTVLKVCVQEIREALGDDVSAPRYIETAHRRGYRFIGQREAASGGIRLPTRADSGAGAGGSPIGRDAEFAKLCEWLGKAQRGEREIVFITGEPGIGKTTLLESFLERVATDSMLRIARGQCLEQYGSGEAYLPVLEALTRLCRGPDQDALVALLGRYAPTWLGQMPALRPAEEFERLEPQGPGATQPRMLRELAEALEALTAERTFVLCLEDVQWADPSTLDLLGALARRPEPARLLVIATYRPAEVLGNGHPLNALMQEMQAHGLCAELVLGPLSQANVAEYLKSRFPVAVLPIRLASLLHQRTEGNPLFLVQLLEDWVREGMLVDVDGAWALNGDVDALAARVPESIRHLVARQRSRLPPASQRVLEAASIAGMEFSAAAVAAALKAEVGAIEERCGRLAERQQFLRPAGLEEWPDGTCAARYGFRHALYQNLWHERVSVTRQQQWHLRIGERKELAYGGRTAEIAAELAVHFEQGRDGSRAVRHLQQAGENAIRRSAHAEAIAHLTRGLGLLKLVADPPERIQQELALQATLGLQLSMIKGLAAPEVERTFNRARELCEQTGDGPQLVPVLNGLAAFYFGRGDLQTTRDLTEQLLSLAERRKSRELLSEAHLMTAGPLLLLGEFVSAHAHLQQGFALYDREQNRPPLVCGFVDPTLWFLSRGAMALWSLGYPMQALQRADEALAVARRMPRRLSLVFVLSYAALLHQFRRERSTTKELADELIALAGEHGLMPSVLDGTVLRGWVLVGEGHGEEGIAQIRQGLTAMRAVGTVVMRTCYLALLADAYREVGRVEDGLASIGEAFAMVDRTGERAIEAELYRLKGELILESDLDGRQSEAEACFQKAIAVAHHQSAKAWELRASTSLSRLWQREGKTSQARDLLSEIYGWFSEGFDTPDLQDAAKLLDELKTQGTTAPRLIDG